MTFYTPFNPPPAVECVPEGASLTQQCFAEDCDINCMISRYLSGGILPDVRASQGDFADLVGLDYQSMLDAVVGAREAFEALPADLRDRFGNDPQRMLDFLADDSNREEAIALGLVHGRSEQYPLLDVTVPSDTNSQNGVNSNTSEVKAE